MTARTLLKTFSFRALWLDVVAQAGASTDGWYWMAQRPGDRAEADKHTDLIAVVIVERAGFPRILRLTLGPLSLMLSVRGAKA